MLNHQEGLTPAAADVLEDLLAGNARFRAGESHAYRYRPEDLRDIAVFQKPKAAIIACSDSRVTPEVIFDQPLGALFASRVPGNVASDSAKWMLQIATGEFKVPLVMVLGHTNCLAVGQLLDGDKGGAGGLHRFSVLSAVYKAKSKQPKDLYRQSIIENAVQSLDHLVRDLYVLRSAVLDGTTSVVSAIYEMETGEVTILETTDQIYGRY